jgi:hypothetical protein
VCLWGAGQADAYIYWTNFSGHTVARANLDGTGVNQSFIAVTGGGPAGVAVDGSHIYWANADAGTIGRANLDGSGAQQNFITGLSTPTGVAVNASYIYWGNKGTDTIGRADLSGAPSSVNTSFVTSPVSGPDGVAVDGSRVYWANNGTGADSIGTAPLAGGTGTALVATSMGA